MKLALTGLEQFIAIRGLQCLGASVVSSIAQSHPSTPRQDKEGTPPDQQRLIFAVIMMPAKGQLVIVINNVRLGHQCRPWDVVG